jgi:hypothetical protein
MSFVLHPPPEVRIRTLAGQACVDVLADYGIPITLASPHGGVEANEPALFGVIGFVANGLRGTCLLGAAQQLVEASARNSGSPRDWIAELVNQLVGRLKMNLLTCGVNVTLTTPLALAGVQLMPLPRLGQGPLAFTSDRGTALLWLELETDESFVLGPEQPPSFSPGDLVF